MAPDVHHVHLFNGNFLLARFTTVRDSPEEIYEVDGRSYEVISVRPPHLEDDATFGWDAQVRPRRRICPT